MKIIKEAFEKAGIGPSAKKGPRPFNPRPLRRPAPDSLAGKDYINISPTYPDKLGGVLYWDHRCLKALDKPENFIMFVVSSLLPDDTAVATAIETGEGYASVISNCGLFSTRKDGTPEFGKWFQKNHPIAADLLWQWVIDTPEVYQALLAIKPRTTLTSLFVGSNASRAMVTAQGMAVTYPMRVAQWERWYVGTLVLIASMLRTSDGKPKKSLRVEYERYKEICRVGTVEAVVGPDAPTGEATPTETPVEATDPSTVSQDGNNKKEDTGLSPDNLRYAEEVTNLIN